jgi:hypothetical protein
MTVQSRRRKSVYILLLSVLILQSACRGWIEKPIVPDTGIAIPRRVALRVTKSDGTVIFLSDSFITSDSIVGLFSAIPHRRTAIARADVTNIQRRVDTTPRGVRIAGKIYLGVVGVAVTAVLVTGLMLAVAVSHQ